MKRIVLVFVILFGCIDPYSPPEINQGAAILVVEGFIDVNGESLIILSRTQNLNDDAEPTLEPGASIWIEDENGVKSILSESKTGNYTLPKQTFLSAKYRIHIIAQNSKEYISGFEPIKISPPIDSLTWDVEDSRVQINVNAKDAENPEGYYRWTYDETWLYTSAFQSLFKYNFDSKNVELREDDIFNCYRKDNSKEILVESTVRLAKNVVCDFPLTSIPQNSEQLKYKYSILVKQYSITKEAFNYWQQLKKTTEDLGTIFGPLPSITIGNIKNAQNSNEPVIGFFSIGSPTTSRIFISHEQLTPLIYYDTPYGQCERYELLLKDIPAFNFNGNLLVDAITTPFGTVIGYHYGSNRCVDCRLTGGTVAKPDFWE